MATLSSTGVGSGLDVNTIVSQLVALERRPIELLQTERSTLDARLSAFGRIQGALDTLRTSARTLATGSTWSVTSATSSDSTALAATSGSATTPGSYAVQVDWLARTQMTATGALAGATTAVGQGTLHIELGEWSPDLTGFASKAGASAVDITIGPGEDTLEKIRDKINATSGAGVRASIVNDASGARLVLQSSATGAENGFRIQVADDDGTGDDASGLSQLAYDPANAAAVMSRSQAARNASVTINGLAVSSASNTLADVIDGVTLKLLKPTTSAVDVTVARDDAAMRKSVDGFVSAYNDLVKLMRDQTRYDAATKTAGTLQGDRTAIGVLGQLRATLAASSVASGTWARAADIGLDVQTDGTIKVDGSKLTDALADPAALADFFAADGATSASDGLGVRLRELTDALLDNDGAISSKQDGLRKRMALNSDRQQALEDRVAATEKRLRAQYQALDTNMARLTGLQNYVTQQLASWNRSG